MSDKETQTPESWLYINTNCISMEDVRNRKSTTKFSMPQKPIDNEDNVTDHIAEAPTLRRNAMTDTLSLEFFSAESFAVTSSEDYLSIDDSGCS